MKDRFEALRKALEAGPTPGPWTANSRGQYWGEEEGDVVGPDGQDIDGAEFVPRVRNQETTRGQAWMRDTAFIAAADPDTIQALLDDRDSWEKQASDRTDDAVRFAQERDALRAALGLGDNEVLVALKRPEGYENTHPELVAEDAIKDTWPEYRTVWPKEQAT